jgi:DNA-binding NarL/FixJ family response regulator
MCKVRQRARVLLIDQHQCCLDSFSRRLEDAATFQVIGQTSTFERGMALAATQHPDLVILDLGLFAASAAGAAAQSIRCLSGHIGKRIGVIHVNASDAPADALLSRELGADGYYRKSEMLDTFMLAATAVIQGRQWHLEFAPLVEMIQVRRRIEGTAGVDPLTPREYEVFCCFVDFIEEHGERSGHIKYIVKKMDVLNPIYIERLLQQIREKLHIAGTNEFRALIKRLGYLQVRPQPPRERNVQFCGRGVPRRFSSTGSTAIQRTRPRL